MKSKIRYDVETLRIVHREDKRYIKIEGWCYLENASNLTYKVEIDHADKDFFIEHLHRSDIANNVLEILDNKVGFRIYIFFDEINDSFRLFVEADGTQYDLVTLTSAKVKEMEVSKSIDYYIDTIRWNADSGCCNVGGWAVSNVSKINFKVQNIKGNTVDHTIQMINRYDLERIGILDKEHTLCGFRLNFIGNPKEKYYLVCEDEKDTIKEELPALDSSTFGLVQSYFKALNMSNLKKAMRYLKQKGVSGFVERIKQGPNGVKFRYADWFDEHKATEEELEKQRTTSFSYSPKISIIVATFNTAEEYLKEMIDTVVNQTYSNWELCIGDGSTNSFVEEYVEAHYSQEKRIKFKKLEKNYGISGNMNGALSLATGDYVALYDHDDLLTPDALYEVVKALQEYHYDIVYTDEDKLDNDRKELMDPHFKPDFSIDLLRSQNYICHFLVVNKKIVDSIDGLNREFDGSQDLDYVLHCSEKANGVHHIPKILYHWRMHPQSTAQNPESKMYCYEAGARAVQAHLDRIGVKGTAEMMPKPLYGMYRVRYELEDAPKVSIVLINEHGSHVNLLISSLINENSYKNIEIIVIDPDKHMIRDEKNVFVYPWNEKINVSKMYNFGVSQSNGEYILFLRDTMNVLDKDALKEMVSCMKRDEVGVIGGKVLDEDNTIQHAGVIYEKDGSIKYPFVGQDNSSDGYMCHPKVYCNYSAVSSMCMLVKASLFKSLNGFNEEYSISFYDLDFCLRAVPSSLIVYDGFSIWQNKSKNLVFGYDVENKDMNLVLHEYDIFRDSHKELFAKGDPYYSPNFDYDKEPFLL